MAKQAAVEMEEASVRAALRRRLRRWAGFQKAENKLSQRRKAVESDIRALLSTLAEPTIETAETRGKLVQVASVLAKDERNVALLEKTLSSPDFEKFAPRVIQSKKLKTVLPDLHDKLRAVTKTRLELDLIQQRVEG